jgi:quercetin dioxygenase-like cupin family protein
MWLTSCLEAHMPVIVAPTEPTHELGSTRFTSLATPTRGSSETAIWRVEIEPGAPATPHRLTREEVFVVLEGEARVDIGDVTQTACAGDAIAVPAHEPFAVAAAGGRTLRMLCCMPVGGQAVLEDGEPFTPPWAE